MAAASSGTSSCRARRPGRSALGQAGRFQYSDAATAATKYATYRATRSPPALRPSPSPAASSPARTAVDAAATGRWSARESSPSSSGRTSAIMPPFSAAKWTTVPTMFPSATSERPRRAGTATLATSSASTLAAIAVLPRSVAETPKRSTTRRRLSPRSSPPTDRRPRPATSRRRIGTTRPGGASAGGPGGAERASPKRATANQATRIAPSIRPSLPSAPSTRSGTPAAAVHARAGRGRPGRSGATSAPRPATASARKVAPPRNVPAAASGSPFRSSAIPAARFSSSNPDTTAVKANAETCRRLADARTASKKSSAPATTSTRPAMRRRTASQDTTRRYPRACSERDDSGVGRMVAPVVAHERAEKPDERNSGADLEREVGLVRSLDAGDETADRDPDRREDCRDEEQDHGPVVPWPAPPLPDDVIGEREGARERGGKNPRQPLARERGDAGSARQRTEREVARHSYREREKRWTAARSSRLLSAAASGSPDERASATQCSTCASRIRYATLSSAVVTAEICVRTSMQ